MPTIYLVCIEICQNLGIYQVYLFSYITYREYKSYSIGPTRRLPRYIPFSYGSLDRGDGSYPSWWSVQLLVYAVVIWELEPCGYFWISWISLDNHRYPCPGSWISGTWISRISFGPFGELIPVRSLFGYQNRYPYSSCISIVISICIHTLKPMISSHNIHSLSTLISEWIPIDICVYPRYPNIS